MQKTLKQKRPALFEKCSWRSFRWLKCFKNKYLGFFFEIWSNKSKNALFGWCFIICHVFNVIFQGTLSIKTCWIKYWKVFEKKMSATGLLVRSSSLPRNKILSLTRILLTFFITEFFSPIFSFCRALPSMCNLISNDPFMASYCRDFVVIGHPLKGSF